MTIRLATASALLALCLACDRPEPIVCGGPTVACTTGCAVLATDGANCGACGRACSEGQVCSQGECAPVCATPLTTCGEGGAAFCADTRSDPAHCGSCDIACPEGQRCAGGLCTGECAAPLTTCGEGATAYCVDTRSDPANCGGCGHRCAGGQACLAGQCTVTCAAPLATCGEGVAAFCADTRSDPAHCGSCDRACDPGQVCAGGSCASTCEGTGSALCDGRCVDLLTDGAHCGYCATACAPGTACTAGRCKPTCPEGQARCGDQCVTLTTDAANCGACGNSCPATAVCNRGTCEAPVCTAGFGLPGQPNFVGGRSLVIAAGDLNGDRLPDLVYAAIDDYAHGSEVDVLLNRGARSFAPPAVYPVGMQVTAVLVGDVDGDGVADVVAIGDAGSQGGQAALLRGVGDGTLRAPVTIAVASVGHVGAALGDLTGDGRADLVLGAGKVVVYPGTPLGFGSPASYSGLFHTSKVALGDVDGDGRLDVIAGWNDNRGHVGVYRNVGGGALVASSSPTVGLVGSIVELAAGDLDGDGLADAVVVQEWSDSAPASQLEVLRSDGAGGYRPADSYPISWYPYGLALGDLDTDGRLDVAVGDWSDTRRVALLRNIGGGILAPAGSRFEEGVKAMVFADLDGDLRQDLAVASGPGFGIHLLWNRAGALEEPALQPAAAADGVRSPTDVTLADLDGDGHRDAVAVEYTRGEVLVFQGAGDGSLALRQVIPWPGAGLVRVGDLDGDGRPDLLVGGTYGAQAFLARDEGFVAGLDLPSPGPMTILGAELVDVDGDGLLDLLSIPGDGTISSWRGRGDGTFDPPVAVGGAADVVRAADVDGNGWPDIVSIDGGKVRVALGLGGGRFAPPVESPLGPPLGTSYYVLEAALGDLDGDGRVDLAVSDGSYPGAVGVLLGRGDGSFGAVQVRQDLHSPTSLRVARFGDGRSAIAIRGAIATTIAIYEVDTHGVLQAPRRWTGLGADGLDVGDIDGDLRPDVVTGALDGLAVLPVQCLR